MRSGDAQGTGQLSRPFRFQTGPDQNPLGILGIPGDDVHQPVNTVAQIHIHRPGIGIQYLRPGGTALVGVAGGVGGAAVGFGLRDPQGLAVVHQQLPHQLRGNIQGVAVIKCIGQSFHGEPSLLVGHILILSQTGGVEKRRCSKIYGIFIYFSNAPPGIFW